MARRLISNQESNITCRDCRQEWDCNECLRIFDTFDDLVYHMQMIHSQGFEENGTG